MGKDIGFPPINSEGMHLFYQKFAEGYILVKKISFTTILLIALKNQNDRMGNLLAFLK